MTFEDCAILAGLFGFYVAGIYTGRALPSDKATFIDRRKNPRNEVVWSYEFRDRERCIEPNRMARLGAPWKENT